MTIYERVTVRPGGLIEVRNPSLPAGAQADVVIQVESEPGIPEESGGRERKPIWEVVAEIGAALPAEAWKDVPSDLSKNLDHYLYGAPRQEE